MISAYWIEKVVSGNGRSLTSDILSLYFPSRTEGTHENPVRIVESRERNLQSASQKRYCLNLLDKWGGNLNVKQILK